MYLKFFPALLVLVLGFSSLKSNEFIVFNEETKSFELTKEITSSVNVQNTFNELKKYILKNFQKNERRNRIIKKRLFEDLKYIKNKNEVLSPLAFEMLKSWSTDLQIPLAKIENFDPNNITREVKEKLIIEANRARTAAYAPYSNFHVGSAILTKSGNVYSGCNFENAAYGSTICAERSALANGVVAENRGLSFQKDCDIVALALVIRGLGSPCGSCRQSLYEFNPNMLIIMSDIDGENFIEQPLHELLPFGFGPVAIENAIVK